MVQVPGASYRLEFSFAGDALPHNLGPPPHHVPSFKSMSVFWDARKVGDVFINALDKTNAGMDWDRASYLLNATAPASTLVVMSTTKGRSGLAVTDFRLWDVTGLPNGGLAPPAAGIKPIHPLPHAVAAGGDGEEGGAVASPSASVRRKGKGGHGVGVLLALLGVTMMVGLGAVMVLGNGGRLSSSIGGGGHWSLPQFWRNAEEGYGVLGGIGIGGGSGGNGDGYQSPYQQAAAVELAATTMGGRRWEGEGEDGSDGDSDGEDEEVMFQRRQGGEGESKRQGQEEGGGRKGGKGGRRKKGGL